MSAKKKKYKKSRNSKYYYLGKWEVEFLEDTTPKFTCTDLYQNLRRAKRSFFRLCVLALWSKQVVLSSDIKVYLSVHNGNR